VIWLCGLCGFGCVVGFAVLERRMVASEMSACASVLRGRSVWLFVLVQFVSAVVCICWCRSLSRTVE